MELTTTQFWTTFFAAIQQYYPEDIDPALKPVNTPQEELLQSYTFVVVGAGAAGSVVANRLTENPEWTVLLIEAGGDEDAVSDCPLLELLNHDSPKDWNYTTVPQKRACLSKKGICSYPRGHVMGGSSTINGMMYVRGHKDDYEEWKKLGLTNWGYSDVIPYFIKAENNTEPLLTASPFHGNSGPLNVQYPRYTTSLRSEFLKAGKETGWQKKDYNEPYTTNIIDYVQLTINGPSRESTSKAYLNTNEKRKNLHVIKKAVVIKVIIEGLIAKGVEYHRNGKKYSLMAEKEVILSAGAINTPKILMMSGIGPKEELGKFNIKVIADLPVGKGMQDHLLTTFYFKLKNAKTITTDIWKTNKSITEYAKYRAGPLTTPGCDVMSFFNPLNETGLPTMQIMIYSFVQGIESQRESLITVTVAIVYPKSVGKVMLKSDNFRDPPLIDPNYFAEDIDYLMFEKGVEKLFEMMKTPTMRKYSPKIYHDFQPLCKGKKQMDFIRCTINHYSGTVYHPVRTARMGAEGDKDAVVNQDLCVKGVKNLRVIDASVMPFLPRANTLAPTVMLAEKAADIIKAYYQFSTNCHNKTQSFCQNS